MSSNERIMASASNMQKHTNKDNKKKNFFGVCSRIFIGLYKTTCKILFPANIKCIACGDDLKQKQDIEVCDKCMKQLEFIQEDACCQNCGAPILGEGKFCLNCKNEEKDFDIARSVFIYKDKIKQLIAGLKYNNKPYISRTLGMFLVEKYKEMRWDVDMIIPVPLSESRRKWRGYNQAELLANVVSDSIGKPINTEALVKIKDTDSQAGLTLQERRKNLRSSFKITDRYIVKNKNILLIDDVLTTGSTASACAKALKKSRAKNVYVLTIAHGKMDIPTQNSLTDIKNLMKSTK